MTLCDAVTGDEHLIRLAPSIEATAIPIIVSVE